MSVYATEEKPIACTLNENSAKARFAWIAGLNRDELQSHKRHGLDLELRYSLSVLDSATSAARAWTACIIWGHPQ